MLTPKGEHSFPCSTRVMFDGRISFDGIATAKTLVAEYYFPAALQSRKNPAENFWAVSYSQRVTCGFAHFFHSLPSPREKPAFKLRISL
ncbi:hypothetical protein SBA4_1890007 [Candidatus Sulfopaludibacter sp. SbA4]|nr:hypothetical protein SBA4_1890007 [Candidatus Sulfopaludibacter sp. SbA4]